MRKIKRVGERAIDQRHLDAARELEMVAKRLVVRVRDADLQRHRHVHGSAMERWYAGAQSAHQHTAEVLRFRAAVIRKAARARKGEK